MLKYFNKEKNENKVFDFNRYHLGFADWWS